MKANTKALARGAAALALAAGLLAAGACGASSESGNARRGDAGAAEEIPAYAPEAAKEPAEEYAPEIDPANFVERVDNPYFPLEPGTTFVFEGETEDGVERVEDYVTRDTKEILGVTCVVLRDRVTIDGELVEETLDWFAQDREGNVWYFGEETKDYEDGEAVSTAGSFEAGKDGAQPGIIMEADPQVGDSYRQEFYEGKAVDMAEVLSLSERVSVPHGSFDNVLLTKDWNPLEPEVLEHKYYAPGVGPIGSVKVVGGPERVDLVEIRTE
jgi:hypothetical protein